MASSKENKESLSARETEDFFSTLERVILGENPPPSTSKGRRYIKPDVTIHPVEIRMPAGSKKRGAAKELNEKQLRRFVLSGELPETLETSPRVNELYPLLLFAARNLNRVRYSYPMCIGRNVPPKSLKDLLDQQPVGNEALEDFAGKRRRLLHRIEATIKEQSKLAALKPLLQSWKRACSSIEKKRPTPQVSLMKSVRTLPEALQNYSQLLFCTADASYVLLQEATEAYWQEKQQDQKEHLDNVIRKLQQLIEADTYYSQSDQSPEAGKKATGSIGWEIDDETLSEMVRSSLQNISLPENRRNRVHSAFNYLSNIQRHYFTPQTPRESGTVEKDGKYKGDSERVSDQFFIKDISEISAHCEKNRETWLEFYRQLHIAELEIENLYIEEKHTPFFENFVEGYLSAEELAFIPPTVVRINSANFPENQLSELYKIAAGKLPVKMLIEVDEKIFDNPFHEIPWALRIAMTTIPLNTSYVLQSTLSNPNLLFQSFCKGLAFNGPAMFLVYCGSRKNTQPHIPIFLDAAAMEESRLLPSFCYNPGAGATLQERIKLLSNNDIQRDWPSASYEYLSSDGEKCNASAEFTVADLLTTKPGFNNAYYLLPGGEQAYEFLPASNYEPSGHLLTALQLVDKKGRLHKAVPNRRILNILNSVRENWHFLQELCGINNSFLAEHLVRGKAEMQAALEKEVTALKAKHQSEMSRTVEALRNDIISGIAAGLIGAEMSLETISVEASELPHETPVELPPQPEAQEESVAVDETPVDDDLNFDEAYIDSFLCTSCNECINLNNRMFGYNDEKQAVLLDPAAGTFKQLVVAAEKCPVNIIHPGKPLNPNEAGLEALLERAKKYI